MAAKLGIYLVTTQTQLTSGREAIQDVHLMIAESASMAEARIATTLPFDYTIAGVGRIGDYDPGIEGHAMVSMLEGKFGGSVIRAGVPKQVARGEGTTIDG